MHCERPSMALRPPSSTESWGGWDGANRYRTDLMAENPASVPSPKFARNALTPILTPVNEAAARCLADYRADWKFLVPQAFSWNYLYMALPKVL